MIFISTFRHGPLLKSKASRRRHRAARFRRARLRAHDHRAQGLLLAFGLPISYQAEHAAAQPGPRPIEEETTALYGISRDSLLKYRCRIGGKPHFYAVSKIEAVDLNTEEDFVLPRLARHDGRAFLLPREPLSVLPSAPHAQLATAQISPRAQTAVVVRRRRWPREPRPARLPLGAVVHARHASTIARFDLGRPKRRRDDRRARRAAHDGVDRQF